jgi:hypothetical protein
MSDLRGAAEQALKALDGELPGWRTPAQERAITALKAALEHPERTLTDEVIADLWHQNGGFHHHFARAVERYLKGEK